MAGRSWWWWLRRLEPLPDIVSDDLAGQDQFVEAATDIHLALNIVGDVVSDQLVQRPEDAAQGVNGRLQVASVWFVDMRF